MLGGLDLEFPHVSEQQNTCGDDSEARMEPQLLKQPLLNYGQELLTALKEEQGIESVGFALQGISRADLQAIKQRDSKDPLLQDPVKRSKFIRFLAHKAGMLYKNWDSAPVCSTTDGENEELCAVMPPLESFMSVPASERKKHFFKCLNKGDIVIGQVSNKQKTGLFVTLVCMDGGLRREIHDLAIKAFCPWNRVPTFSAHVSPYDVLQVKDLVRAVVTTCSSDPERIILCMEPDKLPAHQRHLKLGLVTEEEIPSHHKRLISTHGCSYQEVLERTIGFNNPTTASHLCSALGIPSWRQASLTKALHMKEYPKEDYATALRKAQSSTGAYKSLKDGVRHFKAGNHSEAFACLNKALQIDPKNVDALVARGALFANNSKLRCALEDFEQALTLNPNHPNARKYMSETLFALGHYYEARADLEGAVKTYKKALKVNLSNTGARQALSAMEVKERKEAELLVPQDTRSLSSQASLLAELQGEISKPTKDTREKLHLLLKDEVEKKHKKRRRHRSSSSSSWSSTSSSGRSSSSGYKRHSCRHHRSRRSRKDRKESKAERHRGSKKKRKSHDGHRANTSPPPKEVARAAIGSTAPGGTASECYWKDEPAVVLSSPPAEATKAAAQRSSLSLLSKKLAHLYEDEDEVEIMKGSRVDDHDELSPNVTFLMKSNQKIQALRLFNVDAKSAAASTAYYERKDRSSESARAPSAEPAQSAPRIVSAVKSTEPQPAAQRKGIEFKWKAVKKPLTHAGDSHEEGSVSSIEHREDAPQQQPSRGTDDKAAASSHEEGSIHSDSEPAKRKKDRSSSRESSPKDDDDEGHRKHKLRRRSRADSDSYSSSGWSKSPVRRRRSSRRSADHSDDYSTDRSSVASRGRRRSSRGSRSSDSSRDDSRHRRYSSEDSRDGRRRRSRSYSSDTDGSHRHHSPMRRGGYRPYYCYNNNRGGYYKGNFYNRRYNNYHGGYQNTRYFRGGRGGRRPFRPYYNNRTSPRSYYNSGGGSYQRSSYSRDRRSDSETPQDHGDRSFCPPWKRRNPIVSRAPDAEELKKLREAAAQRDQEKDELAAAEGGASTSTQRINKAAIIRNWSDDGNSRSPARANSPPSRKKGDAPPLPPPLPTDAPPLPESD
ncbi:serine/arginine repetitive matrix protein 2-like [Dermacentor silvarum]|uniref:serine/arginine repetitive matrix protein 2-like n=1 Tax=Dermacentor silvarum TaxID=543639 RepID=UPI002101124C|nr:serine/arginine repetitive matrix protein 2-like [Dermacentor silvarum]